MFEKAKPPKIPCAHEVSTRNAPLVDAFENESDAIGEFSEALPLRAIEWSELTARLSAARDLRLLLRDDLNANSGAHELGFADAATQFFRTNEDDERPINPTALEGRKASSGKHQTLMSEATRPSPFAKHDSADTVAMTQRKPGDAREEQ